jgi:F420-dependent oxidoreductase-like protein
MQLRVFTEPQQGAAYDDLLRVAQATERLGFDAFFRSDHYLRIGGDPTELPGSTDAWISLAGIARETSRIRLGTLVSPVTFRLPGPLAITVAQVDAMSGGRIELGLGTGWFEAEHTSYGIPFPEVGVRFGMLEEQIEIVRGLWETPVGSTYSFSGRHYTLTESPALPKPAQSPHPPLIVGGGGPRRTPRLAARFADEFNLAFLTLDVTVEQFGRVRAACEDAGRDPASLVLSVAQVVCVGADEDELARRAAAIGRDPTGVRAEGIGGTPAEVVDRIGQFADAGAQRVYLQVLDLSDLDHLELIAAEVAPLV